MKKFVILGVVIGVGIFAGYTSLVARGASDSSSVNWWDSTVAVIDTHGFQDVFEESFISSLTSGGSTSLYRLAYSKLRLQPKNDVIKIMAENHSMTEDEVKKVLNGDVDTLQQFAPVSGVKKTVGDMDEAQTKYVMEVSKQFQREYNDLYEQYKIQADVDLSISPAEMFMNGDLLDSGFDLVQDLSVIEYILFEKNTESDVGGAYEGGSDSPVPDGGGAGGNNGGGGGGGDSGGDGGGGDDGDGSNGGGSKDDNGQIGLPQIDGAQATIPLGGDNEISAQVLPDDNCPSDKANELKDALDNFTSENGGDGNENNGDGDGGDDSGDDGGNDGGDDSGGDGGGGDDGDDGGGGGTSTPPPSGDWGSTFCPAIGNAPAGEPQEDSSTMPGLGGSSGDPFSAEGPPFTFSVAICFTMELIMGKVTAGSSTSCIQCEIEQMLAALDEAASDDLLPNKVTGNIFENAKCKKSMAPDMQAFLGGSIKINLIMAPIQTPPNDDLVLDINMFKSWNQFASQTAISPTGVSIPYKDANGQIQFINGGFGKAGADLTKRYDLQTAIPDNTQAQLIIAEKAEMMKNQNAAISEMRAKANADIANLPIKYIEPILAEMKIMRSTFASYGQMYAEMFGLPCDKEIE